VTVSYFPMYFINCNVKEYLKYKSKAYSMQSTNPILQVLQED